MAREEAGGRRAAAGTRPRPERMAMRRNLLWIAPAPLFLTAFAGGALNMVTDFSALALLLLAAWLLGEGLKAEDAYDARKVARRPAVPRKLLASALTGAGVGLATWLPDGGAVAAVIYGALAATLHVAAFGPDPLQDKTGGAAGAERVVRAVDEGERLLEEMRDLVASTGDPQLVLLTDRFAGTARTLFREVEESPRDLTGARRYLGVYLQGGRDAAERYADVARHGRDDAARKDFVALLVDLDETFAGRTRRLIEETRSDLDLEIGVLRERLEREGVRTR